MLNSIEINRYLQNEMSSAERMEFEAQLARDPALKQELNVQKEIIEAAVRAGIRSEFTKAIRQKIVFNRTMIVGAVLVTCVIAVLVFNFSDRFISNGNKEIIDNEIVSNLPFINPPSPALNVPFQEYTFDAEKGETIYYPSGSIIYFPPSALVDASGMPVKGKVKVAYREFADPLDFFLSGIPMAYDSAGKKYNFESSGMCEINAYKDNQPVFVNKNAQPEINLSGKNKNPAHNLYYLDTVSRNWKFMGKDIITEVKTTVNQIPGTMPVDVEKSNLPVKPVKPAEADGDKPTISIKIEPGSFEELFVYDKLRFQIEDESNFRPTDAQIYWENVKLEHTSKEGIYVVSFSNPNRKVSYKVSPVLKGEDYEKAMKVFDEKNKAYQQALKTRLAREKAESDSLNKIYVAMQEKWKLDSMIQVRNEKMRLLQWKSDSTISARNEKMRILQQEKYRTDVSSSDEVIRSFAINNFGIWNCDHPEFPQYEVPLYARFSDSTNKKVEFTNIAVVYGGFNGITQFQSPTIRIIPGRDNMVWAIKDKYFYYFSYKDFQEARIQKETREFTFRMRKSIKQVTSYEEVRDLVGNL